MADVRAKVNSIDSARNMTHAQRIANKMYNNNDFFAGGTVSLKGDHHVRVLSPIYLDGLGELWSAAYTAVETTHTISNDGRYTTEAVVYTNSVTGNENSKNFAQQSAQSEPDADKPKEQAVFMRNSDGTLNVLPVTNPNQGSGN